MTTFCPLQSDVDPLRDGEGVVDPDADLPVLRTFVVRCTCSNISRCSKTLRMVDVRVRAMADSSHRPRDWIAVLIQIQRRIQSRLTWCAIAATTLLSGGPIQAEDALAQIPIVVSEYSSTVWVRSGGWVDIRSAVDLEWWLSAVDFWSFGSAVDPEPSECFTLRIFPTGAVRQLLVTSRGLGPVRFARLGEGVCRAADDAPGDTALELGPLPAGGSRVAVYVDAAHPARAGVPLVGELIFLAEGFKREQVKIELKPQPVSTFWQAFTWTLGIGTPALLTFWLGLWAQRIKGRHDAEDKFFSYRSSKHDEIASFFSDYYRPLLKENDFTQKTYAKLVERKLFEPIPPHRANPIMKSLRKNNKGQFIKYLRRAFPNPEFWSS